MAQHATAPLPAPPLARPSGRGVLPALAAGLLAACARPPSGPQAPPDVIELCGQVVILDDGVAPAVLRAVTARIEQKFGLPVEVRPNPIDFERAHVAERGQYNSSLILRLMLPHVHGVEGRVLVLTDKDTFSKDLNWSTGIAYVGGPLAIVSTHRLEPGFWGEAPDATLVSRRACRVALHEFGHSFGREPHCPDWDCCVHGANDINEIDRTGADYCADCQVLADAAVARIVAAGARRQPGAQTSRSSL